MIGNEIQWDAEHRIHLNWMDTGMTTNDKDLVSMHKLLKGFSLLKIYGCEGEETITNAKRSADNVPGEGLIDWFAGFQSA